MNGEIIDIYMPKDSSELLTSLFTPEIGLWVYQGSEIRAEFDDVRIEK